MLHSMWFAQPVYPDLVRACSLAAMQTAIWQPQLCLTSGHDEEKQKLNDALAEVFAVCKQHYLADPSISGADFFAFVRK